MAAPWRRGLGELGTPRDAEVGPGLTSTPEPSRSARLRPRCILEATSSHHSPPHPPEIPSLRSQLATARDPDPTATAPSPGRSRGRGRPGRQPGAAAAAAAAPGQRGPLGRTAAGPRPASRGSGSRAASGQRLRPAPNKAAPGTQALDNAASPGTRGAGRRAGGTHRRQPTTRTAWSPETRTVAGPGALRARTARRRREGGGGRGAAREPHCWATGPAEPSSVLRPQGTKSGPPERAAALGGRGSDAAASPFSCPGRCSAASSSLGPRRRLSLGAPRASPLHQGRAEPQEPSRKVRACCRLPQLLVAIFNPPPPPPPAFSTSRCLTD